MRTPIRASNKTTTHLVMRMAGPRTSDRWAVVREERESDGLSDERFPAQGEPHGRAKPLSALAVTTGTSPHTSSAALLSSTGNDTGHYHHPPCRLLEQEVLPASGPAGSSLLLMRVLFPTLPLVPPVIRLSRQALRLHRLSLLRVAP